MQSACGFGALAAAGVSGLDAASARAPNYSDGQIEAKLPHHAPRAKRIIFIFMQGGPSQVDTFDYKPELEKRDGESIEFHVARTRKITAERVFKSPWSFKQYGERGQWVSELFPEQAAVIDDLCLVHSMHTEGVAHGPATLFLHTGATNLVRPSVGAWVTYGLGSENQSLPGFVTINPPPTKGGPRNYSNAFLPAAYQGTPIGRAGISSKLARIRNLAEPTQGNLSQASRYDLVRSLNALQRQNWSAQSDTADAESTALNLAERMESEAPGVLDTKDETQETLDMYGIDQPETDDFGRQCLYARRLSEAGVRFVQINYADLGSNPRWDQHSNLPMHETHARATDKPVAGLIKDLKRRGLLEDTIVWWGGEFGRTPFAQGRNGRDHNPRGFTVWLCGGGLKRNFAYGATDDFGYESVQDRVHMHDLHATLLHLLGLDHTRLTYRFAGRDFRLTDVHGRIVDDLFA